jgi:hypothetical protein
MFFRTKTSGPRSYLQIVENRWEDGRPRQRVIATLGRLDHLQQTGQLEALLASGARLAQSVLFLSAHAKGQLPTITTRRLGPALIFERLWRETGCQRVIKQLSLISGSVSARLLRLPLAQSPLVFALRTEQGRPIALVRSGHSGGRHPETARSATPRYPAPSSLPS